MKRIVLCIAAWLFFVGANAQSDSLLIDTVIVQSVVHSSSHVVDISSTDFPSSLAHSIQNNQAIYIKNYGGLSLATLSLRGSSSSQTGVYWNNLSISNNMLGLLDLSLIPAGFMERTELVYGAESSSFGSGNIGGGVYMRNKVANGLKVSLGLGSFENYMGQMVYGFGSKFRSSIKLGFQKIKNDYPYKISNGDVRKLENGDGIISNAMYNGSYVRGKNTFSINYWGTYAMRNIPYTSRQVSGDDSTRDFNHRFNFNFSRNVKGQKLEWNSGFFVNNNQFYQKELINTNLVRSFENRISYKRLFNKFSYTLGLDQSFHVAESLNYQETQNQSRIALFAQGVYKGKIVDVDMRIRQELVDDKLVPVIPELSISKEILNDVFLSVKASRLYRNPTLNDLFWVPGGNPDLKPEQGWSAEFYASYIKNFKSIKNHFSVSVYNRRVKDWIQWTPEENSFLFRPFNINEVWSRGVELAYDLDFQLTQKFSLSNKSSYGLNISTFEKALSIPKIEIGEQVWYTPLHQVNNTSRISYRKSSLQFTYRYFSGAKGINENVDSYDVGDLELSQAFQIKKNLFHVSLSINNIWNESYRIIEFRPMPGRNYLLNITYKLN